MAPSFGIGADATVCHYQGWYWNSRWNVFWNIFVDFCKFFWYTRLYARAGSEHQHEQEYHRMAMTEDEFVAWIAKRERAMKFISESIRGGLGDYDNPAYYGPDAKRDHTPAAMAMCRNCHIVRRAERAILDTPDLGVLVCYRRNRVTFIIENTIEVWFKALDKYGQPSMRKSRQSTAYKRQEQEPITEVEQSMLDVVMPPELTRLFAGHKPKPNTGGVEFEVVVACPPESGSFWEVPLTGAEITELFNTPVTAPAAQVREQLRRRVRIREDAKAQDETGTSRS